MVDTLAKLLKVNNEVPRYTKPVPMEESGSSSGGPEAKRMRVDLRDKTIRNKAIRVCSMYTIRVYTYFELDVMSLRTSENVCGALKSTFHALRQNNNVKPGKLMEKVAGKDFKLGSNVVMRFDVSKSFLESCMRIEGLSFAESPLEKKKWMGAFVPVLSFTFSFKLRMNELRVGHHQYNHEPENGVSKAKISKFGLSERHHPFLEGCTWPPDVQSSMAQSIGPLTVLLKLAHSTRGSVYNTKLIAAAERDFGHFDWASQIAPVLLSSSEAQKSSVINALSELCVLAPPRNQRRAFIPLIWMALFTLSETEIKQNGYTTTIGAQGEQVKTIPYSEATQANDNIDLLDFSGKGAFLLYHAMRRHQFTYPSEERDILGASQAVFHAYWGTFCEDLGLLKWLTDVDFKTRNELGGFFRHKGTTETMVVLDLPVMKYYSKVVSGNVTKRGSTRLGQVCAHPILAGKRKVEYTDDFFEAMERKEEGVFDANSLVERAFNTIGRISTELKANRSVEFGSTSWFNVSHSPVTSILGENTTVVAQCSNKFFLN